LNGFVTYRPTEWLETKLELIFEREFPLLEEDRIVLPDGEIEFAADRKFSLIVDQAFVTIKDFTDPFEFTVGRRNFEDDRHWLYDTSLDGLVVSVKQGDIRAELSAGRESWYDLDLLTREERSRNDTYMLYANYRGIEDIKLAGYTIFRDDRDGLEGRPLWFGLHSQGLVSDNFSYWTELALLLGEDESAREFWAYGLDIGGTYRFTDFPFDPNVTLGFALGSGDGDPNGSTSNEFRQTGLQSNETKFAGVSEFKVYGEALDPELSNLRILTAGLGFRPAHSISVDFVYHHYWLDEFADELRNSAITALMNQDDTQRSKDVGGAFDVVLGIRNLFGVRRLGVDLRAGLFFPGKAFRVEQDNNDFRKADKGVSVLAKFWW
jgi:alginate production protein